MAGADARIATAKDTLEFCWCLVQFGGAELLSVLVS